MTEPLMTPSERFADDVRFALSMLAELDDRSVDAAARVLRSALGDLNQARREEARFNIGAREIYDEVRSVRSGAFLEGDDATLKLDDDRHGPLEPVADVHGLAVLAEEARAQGTHAHGLGVEAGSVESVVIHGDSPSSVGGSSEGSAAGAGPGPASPRYSETDWAEICARATKQVCEEGSHVEGLARLRERGLIGSAWTHEAGARESVPVSPTIPRGDEAAGTDSASLDDGSAERFEYGTGNGLWTSSLAAAQDWADGASLLMRRATVSSPWPHGESQPDPWGLDVADQQTETLAAAGWPDPHERAFDENGEL